MFLALAYFLAELWHGASRRTWLLARLAAAAAVLAPDDALALPSAAVRFVRVETVNPGSRACPTLIPDFLLTGRALAIAVVVGVGVLVLVRLLLSLPPSGRVRTAPARARVGGRLRDRGARRRPALSLAFVVASAFFDDTPLITLDEHPGRADRARRDPRARCRSPRSWRRPATPGDSSPARSWRSSAGSSSWYPNIAALPLPTAISNAYQGVLPTYVYPFQFPVSTSTGTSPGRSLFDSGPALLLLALAGVCVVVGYAAWVWRIALAERA